MPDEPKQDVKNKHYKIWRECDFEANKIIADTGFGSILIHITNGIISDLSFKKDKKVVLVK